MKKEKTYKNTSDQFNKIEGSEIETLFFDKDIESDLRDSIEKNFYKFMEMENEEDSNINVDHILDQIHDNIRKEETAAKNKPIRRIYRIYMKVAAVLLLPLIIAGVLFIYNQPDFFSSKEVASSTITAPLGSRISFILPDGTKGMLNSGSAISYSLPFTNERTLTLDGEGWFEVKKDEAHPFVINALNSSVKVLGTTFNLSAYKDENYVEIVLEEGQIEFTDKTNNVKIIVSSSERLVLKDGKINKSIIDTSKYNGWTEGKLIFRGDPMSEVVRRIMRWYNVDIVLADKELENYSFRGMFQDDKIEDILKFLAMTSPINYEIIPGAIQQDGTYNKEKIIIFLEKE